MGAFLRFKLERWLQRGLFYQLAFVAALVVAVSIIGGLAAWAFSDQFTNPLAAIWWSFLRLTDPGYLGDDEGVALRVVSTILTILGYVLFMGSLIAILTQWLKDTLWRFEQGLSSISMQGHIVIFGWTNRTPEIVRQLLSARGRLARFLAEQGQKKLRIVVVADEVDAERRLRLRNFLGDRWRSGQVFLRSGSATILGDLDRFDLGRAAMVVVPGDEFRYGGAEASDARVVKSLLNLRAWLERKAPQRPFGVVAEVIDPDKEAAAAHAFGGPIEIVPGDAVITRLLAQSILDPRLAGVFLELLTHNEGCSLFVRTAPEFAGHHPTMIDKPGDSVVMLGAVRPMPQGAIAILNPPKDFVLSAEDRLIYLARYFDDFSAVATTAAAPEAGPDVNNARETRSRRVLVLGWSAQLAQLIEDLIETGVSALALTLVSRTPLEERSSWFAGRDFPADRVSIEHIEADALASGTLTGLDLAGRDTVLIATTPNRESAEESDARALTAYELLRAERDRQCAPDGKRPAIILELAHPGSAEHAVEPGDVLLIRPRLLGFLQSQVTLRPPLNAVFDELFMPTGGARLTLRNGNAATDPKQFGALADQLRQPGDIALGVLLDGGASGESVVLCPADDFGWQGNADLVVLSAPPSRGS